MSGPQSNTDNLIDLTADSPPSNSPEEPSPQPAAAGDQEVEETNPLAVARPIPPDLLLVIFIHGFKGNDETFGPFPDRLQHVLTASIPHVSVECIVFPQYETKGVLREAVDRFADWLVTLTVEREVAHGTGGGAGKAKIVLCGHSMGGLLAADTLLQLADTRPDKAAPLWPRVIALITFDTPYLGVHPFVFRNQAAQAGEFLKAGYNLWQYISSPTGSGASTPTPAAQAAAAAQHASDAAAAAASLANAAGRQTGGAPAPLPTSGQSVWQRFALPAAYALGSAVVAGALGTAYVRRTDIADAYGWVHGHLRYVSHLWDEGEMTARVRRVREVGREFGIPFRAYYTLIEPRPPAFPNRRTFCIVPTKEEAGAKHFIPASNSLADSEISAHMGMFEGRTNDGYYQLGLDTAALIREAIMMGRGVYDVEEATEVEQH